MGGSRYVRAMGTPEPGWYEFEGRHRWWDGAGWTDRYLDEEGIPAASSAPPSGTRYDPAMDAKAAPELQPRKSSGCGWACGGCIVAGVVIVALFVAFSGVNRKPYDPNNSAEVVSQCEDLVSGQLKAPSTAEFHSSAASEGSGTWTVVGTVDAENSFGAKIRTDYQCSVRIREGKIERRLDSLG